MKKTSVAVLGLGYVGHPLAINFGKFLNTTGFDISKKKINNFKKNIDSTFIINKVQFNKAKFLFYSNNPKSIKQANFKIIALPTPVYKNNQPDLRLLIDGCSTTGKNLKKGDIIIIESTVYPGTTEEICIPIFEKYSGLKYNVDFYVAYCPERINPGDKKNNLRNIVKIVSSNNILISKKVKKLYSLFIKNIYIAPNIKVAEAAKIIENTQRDINIALMNELAMLFSKLNIKTREVLKAAGTKWNFLNFHPGLVGGHCIGIDPYYLSFKAKKANFNPKLITSGRAINESLVNFISKKISLFNRTNIKKNLKITILGATYKENVSDFRNSKVLDLIKILKKKNTKVFIHDPFYKNFDHNMKKKYNFKIWKSLPNNSDVLIYAIPHSFYKKKTLASIIKKLRIDGLFFDLRAQLSEDIVKKYNRQYITL